LIFAAAWWQRDSAGSGMGRQESTGIGIRRRSVAGAQRGSDGLAGYIAAWRAVDGRHTVGGDSQQELADAVGPVCEVVVQVRRDFGVDWLVATSADSIRILGTAGLHEQSWNPAAA
jgi:hypothetical protein